MFDHYITFESPWFLTLLVLIPILWWWSLDSMAVLGRGRRAIALSLRTIVLILLIMAMAEVQVVRTSDRLTVIYLLDQSLSIPRERRAEMIEYVNSTIRTHRKRDDRVGVIVFGRDASIEIPPHDDDVQVVPQIESLLDPEYTNLADAMKLAKAAFPEDAAKRIVIVSDGNENIGNAVEQGRGLVDEGIGIDVIPVKCEQRADVAVSRLAIPNDIRRGQPFDLKVVVTSSTGGVQGKIVLRQTVGGQTAVISEQAVTLQDGKNVFTVRQKIDEPEFYTYEAQFVADDVTDDAISKNNRATAFTHVRGRGRVLLIEDHQSPGEYDRLAERLRRRNLEVTIQPTDQLFTSLAALQPFDTVILANVPREKFSDDQIDMLVRNTQQMGAGLIMLGGPNSFGAGGWAHSELEAAMPLDFQIKSAKVVPSGALALVIDCSSSMSGPKIEMSKASAIAAVRVLGAKDIVCVVAFDSNAKWVVRTRKVGDAKAIISRIAKLKAGGGTNLRPGMDRAFAGLSNSKAAVKHMIVLSDGQTTGSGYAQFAAQIKKSGITISTVAVGDGADARLLQSIASAAGGKFYGVKNPKALPRIFQKEARRVARPLVFESQSGVKPHVKFPHEMLSGIDGELPPIHGFVMTTVKSNPLVEVGLVSPRPVGTKNSTILASWTYGLGKVVAFTTDTGARWATGWTDWENYDKLFGQMVRWSMRQTQRDGNFVVATDVEDDRVSVVVTALDKNDELLNFLDMMGTVVGPDLKPIDVKMEQKAPGRYVGSFPADHSGSYFVMVQPGARRTPIRTGVNVSYSDEFKYRETNDALLGGLAQMVPKGGVPGRVIGAASENTFRHDLPKAISGRDVWYYFVLIAGCLFFMDVFVRRVHVKFDWLTNRAIQLRNRALRRESGAEREEYMDRLRSRKAEARDALQGVRGDARFEESDEPIDESPSTPADSVPKAEEEEKKDERESYTERLLRAKKDAKRG